MENLLPEWAPGIHPLIIHFPIALLVMAVFASLMDVLLSKEWISTSKIWLYIFGTLSALVAVLSGREAADSASPPFNAEMSLSNHSDMGHYTLYFFTAFTILQLISIKLGKADNKILKILFLLVAGVGFYLLLQAGDMGAKLVYKYGIGISQ